MSERYNFKFNDGTQWCDITFTDKKSFEEQIKELNEYLAIFVRNIRENEMKERKGKGNDAK